MKTFVITFALSLALCAAVGATAQTKSAASVSAPDSVLLSESTDGDYLVRRYMINRSDDNGYSIRYQINMAKLVSTLNGNSKELADINSFVGHLMTDTLLHVRSVEITGYSSPDGPVKFNEALAKRRAADFKNYVDKKYGFSQKFDVSTSSVAEDWEMCRALVAQSGIPDKQAVLQIIDGSENPENKEDRIKQMPAAWDYMKANILPPLRRVELTINYGAGTIVEQRTMIPKPEPALAGECEPVPCEVIDEGITGIIVEIPESEAEFHREVRAVDRMIDREAREARVLAKREARAADRIARQEARAAEKIARKETKAAQKAEKAAAKAARETEKAFR